MPVRTRKLEYGKDGGLDIEHPSKTNRVARVGKMAREVSVGYHERLGREAEARKKQNSSTKAHRSQRDIQQAWLNDMTPTDGDPKTRAVRGKIAQKKEENKERYWDRYYNNPENMRRHRSATNADAMERYHALRKNPEVDSERVRKYYEDAFGVTSGGAPRRKQQR